MRAFFIPRISFDTRTSGAMNEQIIFTVFEDPFAMRLAFDDPFVIGLAVVFGVGALGTMATLALAAFLRRKKR